MLIRSAPSAVFLLLPSSQLFTKEIDRRANQKVSLQQQHKFSGLFADATQSIGLTFQLPTGTVPAQIIQNNYAPQSTDDADDDLE